VQTYSKLTVRLRQLAAMGVLNESGWPADDQILSPDPAGFLSASSEVAVNAF
jgi:hypothetical protein